jgi:hypothetical protein
LTIPYVIHEKEVKLHHDHDVLLVKCKTNIESGYYSDPR